MSQFSTINESSVSSARDRVEAALHICMMSARVEKKRESRSVLLRKEKNVFLKNSTVMFSFFVWKTVNYL